MSIYQKLHENILEESEEASVYYDIANDAESALIKLKNMTDDEEYKSKLENMIVELNSIRMEVYDKLK